MSKWIKLSKTLKKIIDYRGKTPKKLGGDWSENGYRALSALNVKTIGLVELNSIKYLDEDLYKIWMKEEVEKGDILLTSEAPAGQVLIWNSDEKIVLSQRLFALRVNNYFNNYFIKYFIQSDLGQKEILKNTTGSTVFGISAKMFDLINVPNIDINTQTKIALTLKSLDDKIEINNRINAELEAMAKTIYEYWFVQFDFPDANGKPYKSSGGKMVYNEKLKREIPEGWETVSVEAIGYIVGGSTPSTKQAENFTTSGIPWIAPKDLSLNKGNKFISKGETDITQAGYKDASLNLLPKGSVLMSSRAPIGYLAIANNEVTTNQGFKSFVPKEGFSTGFVYYTIKNLLPVIEKKFIRFNI
ncbi:MAG: restriction endonuclease subunit S [Bacteroides sp.]|nr:restriction endonuclease subunit S [Bacteroides sp.]